MNRGDDVPYEADLRVVEPAVAVPHEELSSAALRGVVAAFVLREGTDYGMQEFSLEQKIAHVMGQIERGEAQIWYDPNSASVDIVRVSKR